MIVGLVIGIARCERAQSDVGEEFAFDYADDGLLLRRFEQAMRKTDCEDLIGADFFD